MATTLQRGRHACPLALFALFIALGSNHYANAAMVIDFEQFTPSATATYSRLDFEQDGIEISIYRPGDVSFRLSTVGFGPFGQVSLSPFNGIQGAAIDTPFIFEFSVPVRSLSISMGDFGEDADTLSIIGFEGPGLTGGSASNSGSLPPGPNNIFTVESLNLRSPANLNNFRSFAIQGGGSGFPNSVFYDNLFVVTATAVPEPGSLLLVGCGSLGCFVIKRFRRTKSRL